ncbi:MAG: inorganic diphosphatase [Hyphomicrobiales bacterium]|nr:inorganic diphosphatase [Rhodoblastus sp.]MCC2105102.1 inorganic diphosphatase [Hyphomicrobiales bacterium]MCO5088845.1 inorganic diphosphatase [Methylobacteriaceae bacterium]
MRLDLLPVRDPETGHRLAVVETPKGSRNKYDFDPALGAMRVKSVLPAGMAFPFDFGFLPQTLAGDGDPLDVLILSDDAIASGCVVAIRLLGAIEAEQRRGDGAWIRNDRLIAVLAASHDHADLESIEQIGTTTLDEIEAFFTQYDRLKGVEFRVIGRSGPQRAAAIADRQRRA